MLLVELLSFVFVFGRKYVSVFVFVSVSGRKWNVIFGPFSFSGENVKSVFGRSLVSSSPWIITPSSPMRLEWKPVSTVQRRRPSVVDPRGCTNEANGSSKFRSSVSLQFRRRMVLREKKTFSFNSHYYVTLKTRHSVAKSIVHHEQTYVTKKSIPEQGATTDNLLTNVTGSSVIIL